MRSTRPKPLHVLCGKAMVLYVLDALSDSGVERVVVVVGAGAERVSKKLQEDGPDLLIEFVEQPAARGTADAAAVALTSTMSDLDDLDFDDDSDVLVLPGDVPLLRPGTIEALADRHRESGAAATILTARVADPAGFGRVQRGKADRVTAIVDDTDLALADTALAADADADSALGVEVSTGVYCFRRSLLPAALRRVVPVNRLGELYLSDVIRVLAGAGHPVATFETGDPTEILEVNDRVQLARAEAELRRRTNLWWLEQGVTMVDPERTYIDTTVSLAADVTIFPDVILQGRTAVGEAVEIGPNTRLVDCAVGARARLEQTTGRDAEVGPDAVVGPFAYLPPGSTVASGLVTGSFYTAPLTED
jgi:bifunctional UDP-N-acetylglucosamine pyrophosphorylase/glucosamine-1-phosphate N-acetyltransferase